MEKAIYELSNESISALHKKLLVGRIFCGLGKALNCVNHDTLLLKLNWYGITGKANWSKLYRVDRRENRNPSHETASKCGTLKHGAPQGSILGHALPNDTSVIVTTCNPTHFIK
jgi:hypothetical protein